MTMTDQEVFDKVVNHLLTQNETSYNFEKELCCYRFEGLSCAVGCLIPDDQYHPHLEGLTARGIIEDNLGNVGVPALKGLDLPLLMDLQRIHDNEPTSDWGVCLASLAETRRLEYKGLTTFRGSLD